MKENTKTAGTRRNITLNPSIISFAPESLEEVYINMDTQKFPSAWSKETKEDVNGRNKGRREIGSKGIEIIPFQYITHGGTVLNRKRGIRIGDRDRQACTNAAYFFPRKYAGASVPPGLMSAQRG